MAFDGTLKFDTAIDKSGFEAGISNLSSLARKGMSAVTAAVTAASTAVVGLGTYAVGVGKNFESSMAQVIATMGITKDTVEDGVNSYELLKDAAAAAGESTTFSASEAADALNYLALAGYSAAQAADALPAVLDLAAAGGLDLAYASDLATDAMSALGIEATSQNLTRFGDEMAKTASKANTSVSQLGEAILTVGGTAQTLAGGTTELNAALGVLANRGIKGAEGGTHLRNMILSLSAPTDTAKAALDGLGVSALDADGNMRPLNETFADLDAALTGMSDGQKAEILSDIFNKTDLAAAQAMLAGCGDEFDALTAELENCDGAMSQMAETMNDTLEGDIKSLQSKAEAFGIAIYEDMNEPLRELAQLGGEYVSQLTDAFKEDGFEGLASAVGDVLSQAVTKVSEYLPKIVEIGAAVINSLVDGLIANIGSISTAALKISGTLVDTFIQLAPKLLEAAFKAVITLAKGITDNVPLIKDTVRELLLELTASAVDNLPELVDAVTGVLTALVEVIGDNSGLFIDSTLQIISVLAESLISNIGVLVDAATQLVFALSEYIVGNADKMSEAAVELVLEVCAVLIENAPKLLAAAVILFGALVDALVTLLGELLETLYGGLSELGDVLAEGAEKAVKAVVEWFTQLTADIEDALISGVSGISDAADRIWQSIKDVFSGVGDFFKGVWQEAVDNTTDIIGSVVGFFDGIWDDIASGATSGINWLISKVENGINYLIGGLNGIGFDLPDIMGGGHVGFDVPEVSLPRLARGGIVDSPTIAQIGEAGREAVIPLENNTGWIAQLAEEIARLLRPSPQPSGIIIPESAVQAFASRSAAADTSLSAPSPTSDIVNNYNSYSTYNNAPAAQPQPMTINAQFVVGEEVVAEGVIDLVSDEIDERQGVKIELSKRGVTT